MKKLIIPALIFCSLSVFSMSEKAVEKTSAPYFRVISDFDDTIKRSHIAADNEGFVDTVDGGARTFGRAFLFTKIFNGIPELYQAFVKNYKDVSRDGIGLYVLSASPNKPTRKIIQASLYFAGIPYEELFTRDFSELGHKIEYKIENIESVMKGNSDKLILIGDDVEADPDVYKSIESKHKERVEAIYIRKIKNRKLAKGIIGFYSAFEVAAREYSKKRINLVQVEEVATAILDTEADDMRRVIPYYAHCPKEMKEFTPVLDPELFELEFLVQIKITEHCRTREED